MYADDYSRERVMSEFAIDKYLTVQEKKEEMEVEEEQSVKEVSVKELTGTLKAFTQDTITLETEFEPEYVIPRSEISTVKLSIDF